MILNSTFADIKHVPNIHFFMKKTILFCLSTFSIIAAYAQTGQIKGSVKTVEGLPAQYIYIVLKETGAGTESNSLGNYEFKSIQPGTYSLIISSLGLKSMEQKAVVSANETTLIPEIRLLENAQQLKEIQVTATVGNNERVLKIGKAGIAPMDLPQSVSSVNKEVLDRQQSASLGDVVKNFNGVYVMGTTGGYQEELAGRGFAYTSANTFKNGIRFNNAAMPEMSSLERVEVMKGSSAILYGNVAAGGVINLVTKKPTFETGGEISMKAGSYDYYKPSVDVYGVAGKSAAYRFNTTYQKANSFRDEVESDRIYINPSFLFKISPKTDILLEGDYLSDQRTADFGVGAINYELIDVPRNRFIGVDWSYYNTEQLSAGITITHRFAKDWQLSSTTGYQKFKSDLFANQRPNGNSQFIKTNGDWIRGLQRTQIDEDYIITQLDLTRHFSTGSFKHTLLLGADADKYHTNNTAFNAVAKYDTTNVYDPAKFAERKDIPVLTPRLETATPVSRAGIYLQDLVSVTEKIKLLAGIRFSYLESNSNVFTYSSEVTTYTSQYDHAWSPRVGLVYQPVRNMSLFASYANSFTPNTGMDMDGNALPPSTFDQYEAGIKNDFFNGLLSANVTLYRIINSNLAQVSQENGNTNTNIKELTGEVTSKGIEADVMSKEWKGISLIAGYSYNDTRYTKSNTYETGSKLRYNPAHTANASIYYTFRNTPLKCLHGMNAGFGALYIGDRYAGRSTRVNVPDDTYELIPLPAYTTLEASLGYDVNKLSFRVKVSNILDSLSYNAHDDNSINPIAPRQITGTLTIKL